MVLAHALELYYSEERVRGIWLMGLEREARWSSHREGYLMQYDEKILRQLQLVELGMLLEINKACKTLSIQYFLDSGTALGAARHKGFIPWDDDVDLGMLRVDYERFIAEAPSVLPPNFKICTPENTEGYAPFFAKVMRADTRFATAETIEAGFGQGVFIDIFPYDVLSTDASVAQAQKKQCDLCQKLSYLYHSGSIVVPHKGALGQAEKMACRMAHQVVRRVATPQKLAAKFDIWAKRGADNPGTKYAIMAYSTTTEMPEDVIFPLGRAHFEGHELPVPGNLDEYLTILYGNWRQLPKVEDRRNHAPMQLDLG